MEVGGLPLGGRSSKRLTPLLPGPGYGRGRQSPPVGQELGEAGAVCTFETVAGEQFSLARPAMSKEVEADVREMLRAILDEEGGL